MFVGINHPWRDCGHDFGPRPIPWAAPNEGPRCWREVEAELRAWRELGLRVSRFWILAGGVNYPAGRDARDFFDVGSDARSLGHRLLGRLGLEGGAWWRPGNAAEQRLRGPWSSGWRRLLLRSEGLPPLPQGFLDDFRGLLRACEGAGVALMPTLLSFEFFQPLEVQSGDVLSGGRGALVFGNDGRSPAQIEAFLDAVLEPLLDVCEEVPRGLFAWDLLNEPDWVVRGGPMHLRVEQGKVRLFPWRVRKEAMAAFLQAGLRRLSRRGFLGSIGFKQAAPRWLGPEAMAELRRAGAEGRYLHQLHHYPSPYEPQRLPPHDSLPIQPCIVGEFPTAYAGLGAANLFHWGWPESLGHLLREQRRGDYLRARLRCIEDLGYPGALLWAGRSGDPMCAWTPEVQAQVAAYRTKESPDDALVRWARSKVDRMPLSPA